MEPGGQLLESRVDALTKTLSTRHLRFASRCRSVHQKPAAFVLLVDNKGEDLLNRIAGTLRNPRSTSLNLELDRQLTARLSVRVAYQQRNTEEDFIVSPLAAGPVGTLLLSNDGSDSYREYQIAGRYRFGRSVLNVSHVRSRAFGDLNDVNQFFGTLPQAVIQPNAKGRLAFDAPNRFLLWGDFELPWKLTSSRFTTCTAVFPIPSKTCYANT